MTNADKFKHLFGIYATELWAMPESDFLEWLNADAQDMPTVERKTGKWVESDTDGFVCSVCRNGYRCQPTLMGKPMFEYCPVCGAKMEETK